MAHFLIRTTQLIEHAPWSFVLAAFVPAVTELALILSASFNERYPNPLDFVLIILTIWCGHTAGVLLFIKTSVDGHPWYFEVPIAIALASITALFAAFAGAGAASLGWRLVRYKAR